MQQRIEIVDGGVDDLERVYESFRKDFAADELKDYHHLEVLIRSKRYKLLLAKSLVDGQFVGYAFLYQMENVNTLWLDYLAIHPEFQNEGLGTLFFQGIAKSQKDGKGIFIEVEIPEQGEAGAAQRRGIHFYERLGAKWLAVQYILPTNNGGFPMSLYLRPAADVIYLPKQTIKEAITAVFNTIHSDVKNRETILNKMLPTIMDEYF